MRKGLVSGLVLLTQACGPVLEGDPLGSEEGGLSMLAKGHVAIAETSHSEPPSVFMSWGYIYYRAPTDPTGPMTLLARPSSYPKALAAVRLPPSCSGDICDPRAPRQCVFWIEGANVRGTCESRLLGWGGSFTLSSTNVQGGEIRRLVAVSEPGVNAPALLALTTNNKVLVNWYQSNAWAGWCVAATWSSATPHDIAAYQRANGNVSYTMNKEGWDTVTYQQTLAPFSCPNTSGTSGAFVNDDVGPLERIAVAQNSSGALFGIADAPDGQPGRLVRFTFQPFWVQPPEPLRAVAYRNSIHDGKEWDALYVVSTDGSLWESEELRGPVGDSRRVWTEMP
jgi:hypothetical protein